MFARQGYTVLPIPALEGNDTLQRLVPLCPCAHTTPLHPRLPASVVLPCTPTPLETGCTSATPLPACGYLRAGRVTGEGSGTDTVRFVEEGCMVVCEPGGPWASVARADLSSCLGTKGVVDACVAAVGQPQQVCVWEGGGFALSLPAWHRCVPHASARKFSLPCIPHSMRPLCARGSFSGINTMNGCWKHIWRVRGFLGEGWRVYQTLGGAATVVALRCAAAGVERLPGACGVHSSLRHRAVAVRMRGRCWRRMRCPSWPSPSASPPHCSCCPEGSIRCMGALM